VAWLQRLGLLDELGLVGDNAGSHALHGDLLVGGKTASEEGSDEGERSASDSLHEGCGAESVEELDGLVQDAERGEEFRHEGLGVGVLVSVSVCSSWPTDINIRMASKKNPNKIKGRCHHSTRSKGRLENRMAMCHTDNACSPEPGVDANQDDLITTYVARGSQRRVS
jgi:hypothetical protein